MQTVVVELSDGSTVPVRMFPANGLAARSEENAGAERPVLLLVPGLGVPGGYYQPFATELAARGFDVAVTELRGNGDSRPKPSSASAYGYHDLVAVDFPAVFAAVRDRFPDRRPYLVGHSMGGQLGVLYAARARGKLSGLVLLAAGTPYHRGFRGLVGPGVLAGTAAVALTANLAGVWPGDRISIGFGRQSRVLMSDWARLARTGRFAPAGADVDYEQRIRRLTLPVLSITMGGDEISPPGAAAHLLDKLPNAEVTRWRQPESLGHNGWVRQHMSTIDRIEQWLRER